MKPLAGMHERRWRWESERSAAAAAGVLADVSPPRVRGEERGALARVDGSMLVCQCVRARVCLNGGL